MKVNVTMPVPEAVDLGLSVKWASANMGASSPLQPGAYIAWGETRPKAGLYTGENYRGFRGVKLEPEKDAAAVRLGGGWRMPDADELWELINKCTWQYVNSKDSCGYIITSNVPGYEGRSIFLPTAGYRANHESMVTMNQAHYGTYKTLAYNTSVADVGLGSPNKSQGCPIRPVLDTPEGKKKEVGPEPVKPLGHNALVDLGLSVLWADCNVGAESPEEPGVRFAWGETEQKTYYTIDNYKYKQSYDNGKEKLDVEYDAAHVNWGGEWRMPTKEEYAELFRNCEWVDTTLNGVEGFLFTSKVPGYTSNSIFLPFTNGGIYKASGGEYLTSDVSSRYKNQCVAFLINKFSFGTYDEVDLGLENYPGWDCPDSKIHISSSNRYDGGFVRAVCPKEKASSQIIKLDNGSITFWVDGELPDPKLYRSGLAYPRYHIGDSIDQMVFRCSYDYNSEKFIYFEKPDGGASFHYSTPFFNGMIDAFAFHNPVVLSPDVLWMLICQGFSHYVNENSESMRDILVDFSGSKALSVRTTQSPFSKNFDWAAVTDDFTRQMRSNVQNKEVVDMVVADFSTTDTDNLITSRITLMNTMQKFFEYRLQETICGIPYVTLQGTPDDWKKFAAKVHHLRDYGLDWWADQLEPIAAEFVKASQGNPDGEFWKNIVKKTRPGELRGYGCLPMGGETKFDGWFLKFLPFTENGMTPNEVCMDDKMLSEICKTDFTYMQVDDNGKLIASMPMKLWGGIVGCQQDEESTAISFKTGWMASFDTEGVDNEPQFPGGDEALKQYIRERVQVPEEIRKAVGTGELSLNVLFYIDWDGTILKGDAGRFWWYELYKSQRGIEDNLDREFEEAVEAAIKSMPKWYPATYGGIAVPFEKNIKVEF
jgi:hypothetical protein